MENYYSTIPEEIIRRKQVCTRLALKQISAAILLFSILSIDLLPYSSYANSNADLFSGDDTKDIEKIIISATHPTEKWRLEANQRINQYRKANLIVKVVDKKTGLPISNADISISLLKHKFKFGGIVNSPQFAKETEKYKKLFLDMGFNASGFNNALKYKLRKGFEKFNAEKIIKWFRKNKIFIRGHCLVWPGDKTGNHLPQELLSMTSQYKKTPTESLKNKIYAQTINMIVKNASKWDVDEWDVLNEPRGNHLLQDISGDKTKTEKAWFNCAFKNTKNKNISLFLNENRVISDPKDSETVLTNKIKTYYDNVRELLKSKAPLSGLGFQSRFTKIISPEIIYSRLSLFNELQLPIVATEMEMKKNLGSEFDKAMMTERVMTIYFSHPKVTGIYAWTILNKIDDTRNRGLLNPDYTPNLRGKIWLYLSKHLWNTKVLLKSDNNGEVSLRAFKGKYKITVKNNNKNKNMNFQLDKESVITVKI